MQKHGVLLTFRDRYVTHVFQLKVPLGPEVLRLTILCSHCQLYESNQLLFVYLFIFPKKHFLFQALHIFQYFLELIVLKIIFITKCCCFPLIRTLFWFSYFCNEILRIVLSSFSLSNPLSTYI